VSTRNTAARRRAAERHALELRFADVDLAGGVIRVERAYDPSADGFIEPKSRAGKRSVPIPAVLRDYLLAHKLRVAWNDELVFGRTATTPLHDSILAGRARTVSEGEACADHAARGAAHVRLLMIADGVNANALTTYMVIRRSRPRSTATGTCSPATRTRLPNCSTRTSSGRTRRRGSRRSAGARASAGQKRAESRGLLRIRGPRFPAERLF
jgi:hypothetical protein